MPDETQSAESWIPPTLGHNWIAAQRDAIRALARRKTIRTSETERPIRVSVPATPVEQAAAAGWLATAVTLGVTIGDHFGHQWLIGGVAGLIGGQRLWNR